MYLSLFRECWTKTSNLNLRQLFSDVCACALCSIDGSDIVVVSIKFVISNAKHAQSHCNGSQPQFKNNRWTSLRVSTLLFGWWLDLGIITGGSLLMFVACRGGAPLFCSERSGRPPFLLHHTSCSFAEDNVDAPVALWFQMPPTVTVRRSNPHIDVPVVLSSIAGKAVRPHYSSGKMAQPQPARARVSMSIWSASYRV